MLRSLKDWYEELPVADQNQIKQLSGHSWALLDFPIPDGFFNALLGFWDPHRHVYRFGDRELMPSLEEYAYLSGLKLSGPCVQVTPGCMMKPFLSLLGLRKEAIRSCLDEGHILPIDFLCNRFSSIQGFRQYKNDFNIEEEQWSKIRVDAFLICLLSRVYFPIGFTRFDIGLAQVVMEIKKERTVIPLILVETLRSLSYCKAHPDGCFRGSPALLYIWTMGHLNLCSKPRRLVHGIKKDISANYRVKPRFCNNQETWKIFFISVKTEDVVMYTGWCPPSFLVKVPNLDFIPLAGLRGMISYFPSAIAAQFNRFQDIPAVEGGQIFCCQITVQKEKLLNTVYEFWDTRIISDWSEDEPPEKFSANYHQWVVNQRRIWEARLESRKRIKLSDPFSTEDFQSNSVLAAKIVELQGQVFSVTIERDRAISVIQMLRDNVDIIAAHLKDQAPPGVDNSALLDLLAWVHQNLNLG